MAVPTLDPRRRSTVLDAWLPADAAPLEEAALDRLAWMLDGVEEVVGIDHLHAVLAGRATMAGDQTIRAYVGFEPSGKAHIGWLVLAQLLRRLLDAQVNVLVFLADWHAWLNDKFGGSLEAIETCAAYMEDVFRILLGQPPEGEGPGQLRFVRASELVDDAEYWATVIRCAKGSTLARARKTLTIMGRDEGEADSDLSKYLYPPMQAADIVHMKLDLAIGGMDQRKAHMYMRDVAERQKWPKATCIHTPILSSLKHAGGRMESFDHKMSKSDPNSAVLLHDGAGRLRKKLRGAWLDPEEDESPVYELVEHLLLPTEGQVRIERSEEHGGDVTYADLASVKAAIRDTSLHPLDLKQAVSTHLADRLAPLRDWFEANPDRLRAVDKLTR